MDDRLASILWTLGIRVAAVRVSPAALAMYRRRRNRLAAGVVFFAAYLIVLLRVATFPKAAGVPAWAALIGALPYVLVVLLGLLYVPLAVMFHRVARAVEQDLESAPVKVEARFVGKLPEPVRITWLAGSALAPLRLVFDTAGGRLALFAPQSLAVRVGDVLERAGAVNLTYYPHTGALVSLRAGSTVVDVNDAVAPIPSGSVSPRLIWLVATRPAAGEVSERAIRFYRQRLLLVAAVVALVVGMTLAMVLLTAAIAGPRSSAGLRWPVVAGIAAGILLIVAVGPVAFALRRVARQVSAIRRDLGAPPATMRVRLAGDPPPAVPALFWYPYTPAGIGVDFKADGGVRVRLGAALAWAGQLREFLLEEGEAELEATVRPNTGLIVRLAGPTRVFEPPSAA
jgi:hypothetical protein